MSESEKTNRQLKSQQAEQRAREIIKTLNKAAALRSLKRKAYRCRFYECFADTVARRLLEFFREVGPYTEAVRTNHFPKTKERLHPLSTLLQAIQAFSGEEPGLEPEEVEFQHDAHKLILRYEAKIVKVLERASCENENRAGEAVHRVAKACEKLLTESFAKLNASLDEVENAVCAEAVQKEEPHTLQLAVLSLDLAQYGRHIETLDQYLHASGVYGLNKQIDTLIKSGLKSAAITEPQFLFLDTGDGAVILFKPSGKVKPAALAVRFARSFFKAVEKSNKDKPLDFQLHFRIGVSTGDVVLSQTSLRTGKTITFSMGGKTIGTSVRLQSAAKTGEILVCENTFSQLGKTRLASGFSQPELVRGKEHEPRKHTARRCRVMSSFQEEQTDHLQRNE